MRRFILTGAPGAGKTTLLRALEAGGYAVVDEAATDIIAQEQAQGASEPWTRPDFVTKIVRLQERRQAQAAPASAPAQFFDRSPLDTYALAVYVGERITDALHTAVRQAQDTGAYEQDVFFVANLGVCEPSAARKISFEEALRFEQIHAEVYAAWGYTCINVPRQTVEERVQTVSRHLARTCRHI